MAVLKYKKADGTYEILAGGDVDQAYVDELITVSTEAPTGTPTRDNLLWIQVPA